ncbi:MAG: glycosyltransferase [Polyangiaceae bacterium]
MRLLHVHSGNLFGGVETMLLGLKKAEPPELVQSYALCWQARFADELAALRADIARLPPVHLRNPLQVLRARAALRKILRDDRPDVIAFHSGWSQLVFATAASDEGVSFVRFVHGIPSKLDWMDALAMRHRPRKLICNGEYTERIAARVFPKIPRAIVRPTVDIEAFAHNDEARARVRRELGVDDDTVVILQVSRLEPWKGQALLLEALALLQETIKWRAWIVGGAQRDEERAFLQRLIEQAKRLGLEQRVDFLGERRDVPALMSGADVFCQPNLTPEPFGVVFVEALAAGLPVVTTHMGGGATIVGQEVGELTLADAPSVAGALLRSSRPTERNNRAIERSAQAADLSGARSQAQCLRRAL